MPDRSVTTSPGSSPTPSSTARTAARAALGSALIGAGVGHWTFAREGFQAQVPDWTVAEPLPWTKDHVVLGSGVVEIALGTAILAAPRRRRRLVGTVAALFFVAVFPGNLAQYTGHRSALNLDTDRKRFVRLLFQPGLVAWAWWSTRDGV